MIWEPRQYWLISLKHLWTKEAGKPKEFNLFEPQLTHRHHNYQGILFCLEIVVRINILFGDANLFKGQDSVPIGQCIKSSTTVTGMWWWQCHKNLQYRIKMTFGKWYIWKPVVPDSTLGKYSNWFTLGIVLSLQYCLLLLRNLTQMRQGGCFLHC